MLSFQAKDAQNTNIFWPITLPLKILPLTLSPKNLHFNLSFNNCILIQLDLFFKSVVKYVRYGRAKDWGNLFFLLSFYWPATEKDSTSKGNQSICLLLLPSSALLSVCTSEPPGCPVTAFLKLDDSTAGETIPNVQ